MAKSDIQIIYDDADILLINKPAGVSVTADRSGLPSLLDLLNPQINPAEKLRLVHRLDKETSGIMLLARHRDAQSLYSHLFAKRQISKLYLAIVQGPLQQEFGRIKAPIARSRRNPRAMYIHPRLGKEAITHWKKLADFGRLSLLAVQPVTGRTHQIRIHMAHRGLPLAIDPVYGNASPLMLSEFKHGYHGKHDRDEPPLIDRLTLHAYQLRIPIGDEMRTFTARPDKKFAAAIKLLAKHTATKNSPLPETIETILKNSPLPFMTESD